MCAKAHVHSHRACGASASTTMPAHPGPHTHLRLAVLRLQRFAQPSLAWPSRGTLGTQRALRALGEQPAAKEETHSTHDPRSFSLSRWLLAVAASAAKPRAAVLGEGRAQRGGEGRRAAARERGPGWAGIVFVMLRAQRA